MLDYQLLSPEEEIEEIFPYRRVWQTLSTEMSVLLGIVAGVILATRLELIEDVHQQPISILLALVPIGLFYIFSVRREQQAIEPRSHLMLILILSIIVANGVAWPIIESVITPDRWMTNLGFFSRIIGYSLTIGNLAIITQYVVVRYTAWPNGFRSRLDGIAYSVPAAIGYSLVLNVHYILNEEPILSAAAIRILTNVYLQITVGAVMGYFLAEMTESENPPPIFWLPMGLSVAAFLGGVYIAFRRITVISGMSSRVLGPLFLVIGFAVFILSVLAFVIESADERTASRAGIQRIR